MGLFGKKSEDDGTIYSTSYGGFWIKVYPNRIEFKAGAGSQNIPINQVASVQLGMTGYMQIIIETTGGKKYKIPCSKKKEVKDAIYKAQSMPMSVDSATNTSVADELLKLNSLKEQGILSEEEFQAQKKKLLS